MKTNIFGPAVEFEHYADGRVAFKLRDIVAALGLDWAGQYHKTKSDPFERYKVFSERFETPDEKTAMSVAIFADNVQNFLDDINVNRCPKDAAVKVLSIRDSLRGRNLVEEALQHLI